MSEQERQSEKAIEKQQKEQALNDWFPLKIKLAKRFIADPKKQASRNMVKGSVHLCELGENLGSEQGEERPVLIVSNDRINSSSSNVKIIPLSKNLKKKTIKNRKGKIIEVPRMRTHFFLKKSKYPFLTHDSAAMAEGITTVSKVRIGKHMGELHEQDLKAVLSRLKWIFDL